MAYGGHIHGRIRPSFFITLPFLRVLKLLLSWGRQQGIYFGRTEERRISSLHATMIRFLGP